jgi:UDPglucose 6-dehydrogenase
MDVAVIGTGYVGLVAGACFAELGHQVTCVDNNVDKVRILEGGGLPIYEPGLEEMVPRNLAAGRLSFTTDLASALVSAEVIFVAVGTPPGEDGAADLQHVEAVARSVGALLARYTVLVVKSTVPVGTCERVRAIVSEYTDVACDVVSNPEFLREGVAVRDFMVPDRIVVGAESERAQEVMSRLYAPLVDAGVPLVTMDVRSSELTKYAANAMLATRISFANEIANLCARVGADIEHVRRGMGSDHRIGPHFLQAGLGYGGSCFPKDVKALVKTAAAHGLSLRILDAVEQVNEAQKGLFVSQVLEHFGPDLSGRVFAVWGLAFKPDTDDMREAPSLTVIRGLQAAGAKVRAHDPAAHETAQLELGDSVDYLEDPYACLEGADALLLLTEWSLYRTPDWLRVSQLLRGDRVYDGRNLWSSDELRLAGLHYAGIGRP